MGFWPWQCVRAYLLGLLAMIKCSICSCQCDNWYVSNWRLACHIYFWLGKSSLELARRASHVALALHKAGSSIPLGVTMLDTHTPQQHSKGHSFSMCVALRGTNVALPILSNNTMHIFSQKRHIFRLPAPCGRGELFFFLCNLFIRQINKKIECTWRRPYHFFFGCASFLDFGNLKFYKVAVRHLWTNECAHVQNQSEHEMRMQQPSLRKGQ